MPLQGPRAEGSGTFPSEEIQRLQQQNSSLRAAIANMRRDMESLSEQLATAPPAAPPTAPPTAPPAQKQSPAGAAAAAGVPEYCQALQEEVAELKARCRLLQNQLEEASKAPVPAPGPAPAPALPVTADNAYLQNHTRSLNETIGGLRAEKVSSAATLRKQEVRLAHLESTLAQLTQQIHSKQVECDELRFELANQKKRAAGEEAGLRQRLAAVEMELDEVRREAEEYQRGSLLQNLEAVALGNQVSALKLDIASGREPIVVEQSAALRQLQEENLRLRQQLLGQDCGERRASAPLLRSKLKQAVRCIAQLTQDRQRLIEVGNRLRSRLTEAGLDDVQQPGPVHRPVSAPESSDSAKDPTQLQPRLLSALEQLQYRLTTQALQYAQLDHHKKAARSRFSRKGTSESDSSINPWDQHGHTRQPHTRGKKENTPPEASQSQAGEQMDPGQASGMGRPSSPSQALMSSVGTDESLGDIWRMLERGSDLSAFTARSSPDRGGEREHARGTNQGSSNQAPGSQVRVQGTKMAVQERRKPMTSRAESAKNPRAHGKTGKIRNYNIKD